MNNTLTSLNQVRLVRDNVENCKYKQDLKDFLEIIYIFYINIYLGMGTIKTGYEVQSHTAFMCEKCVILSVTVIDKSMLVTNYCFHVVSYAYCTRQSWLASILINLSLTCLIMFYFKYIKHIPLNFSGVIRTWLSRTNMTANCNSSISRHSYKI